MKVQIKVQPSGAYNGAPWPEKGETIDLPDHIAEGMLESGFVIKPGTAEAKEDKAEADAEAKAAEKAEAARVKAEKEAAEAQKAADEAAAKVEAAVAPQADVETAVKKTTPRKR